MSEEAHGHHQDEMEALAAGMDLRQIRQAVADPDDIRLGMQALRMMAQSRRRLDRVGLEAAPRPMPAPMSRALPVAGNRSSTGRYRSSKAMLS